MIFTHLVLFKFFAGAGSAAAAGKTYGVSSAHYKGVSIKKGVTPWVGVAEPFKEDS